MANVSKVKKIKSNKEKWVRYTTFEKRTKYMSLVIIKLTKPI